MAVGSVTDHAGGGYQRVGDRCSLVLVKIHTPCMAYRYKLYYIYIHYISEVSGILMYALKELDTGLNCWDTCMNAFLSLPVNTSTVCILLC